MTTESKAKTSLVTKLAEILGESSRVPKRGVNQFHKYKYVLEADLVEEVREKLSKHGIFISASTKRTEVIELSKPNNKTGELVVQKVGMLFVEYTFRDGTTCETFTVEGVGEIDQDGGKGIYKAQTGAMKYMLMKNFLIDTGDDPEDDNRKPAKTPAAASDYPKTPVRQMAAKGASAAAPLPAPSTSDERMITEPQKEMIFAMWKKFADIAEMTPEQAEDDRNFKIKTRYDVDSMNDMTLVMAKDFIDRIMKAIDIAGEAKKKAILARQKAELHAKGELTDDDIAAAERAGSLL